MSQTIVTYNEVSLFGCLTQRIPVEPAMEDSGTDRLYDRFRIVVSGMVHAQLYSAGDPAYESPHVTPAPGGLHDKASEAHRNIRHNLMQPRKYFVMQMGSQVFLEASPFPAGGPQDANKSALYGFQDVNNGPKPIRCEITHVASNNVFKVEFEIEICILRCDFDEETKNTGHVLSNKWSVADEIDRDMMTLRVWQGRLRVSSGVLNPQSFRGHVVPILQAGFVRQQMRFLASSDGLHLDYQIVDKEVAFSAPNPATSWEFTVSMTGADALRVNMEASVRLRGDRKTSKQVLIQLAAQIIDARLRISQRKLDAEEGQDNWLTVEGMNITDIYGSDINEVAMTWKIACSNTIASILDGKDGGFAVQGYRGLGIPLSGKDIQSYDFNLSRGANVLPELTGPIPLTAAFHAYLQDSCNGKRGYGEPGGQLVPKLPHSFQEQQAHEIEAYELPPDEFEDVQGDSYLTPEHNANPYSFYRAYSQYEVAQGQIQLPIARGAAITSATPSDTCSIVQVCEPIAKRHIMVEAERSGKPPELPAAATSFTDENNITYTLLNFVPSFDAPHRDMAGGVIYQVRAQYTYAMSRPPTEEEKLRIGMMPWDAQAQQSQERRNVAINTVFTIGNV